MQTSFPLTSELFFCTGLEICNREVAETVQPKKKLTTNCTAEANTKLGAVLSNCCCDRTFLAFFTLSAKCERRERERTKESVRVNECVRK